MSSATDPKLDQLKPTELVLDPRWDELAELPFDTRYPSEEARVRLMSEHYFQRAVQVYQGAMPAVNMVAIRDGSEAVFGSGYNILPIWKQRMDATCKIPTPNADVIYSMSYLDLKKDGPLVVVAPPHMISMFTDFWQRPLTDVGLVGPDRGQGGLYLLLPPDYEGNEPEGYFTFRSPTYNVFLFWRTLMKAGADGPDPTDAVAIAEQTLVYPFRENRPDQWKRMEFPDASGVPMDMVYPMDSTYFDRLAELIEYEPIDSVDPYLRGLMASIGIIKGQPFAPADIQRAILDRAAAVAHKIGVSMVSTHDAVPAKLYYTDKVKRSWQVPYPAIDEKFFADGYLSVDARQLFFTVAYSSSSMMVANNLHAGARYPYACWDADGELLSGERTYHFHMAADPPAKFLWAFTAYDPWNGTMIDTGEKFPSINSLDGRVQANDDGTQDLYLGPECPDGVPEANWIKTNPGEGYFMFLRFYGVERGFYEDWIPEEIVRVT
jgi:hypothetical protein